MCHEAALGTQEATDARPMKALGQLLTTQEDRTPPDAPARLVHVAETGRLAACRDNRVFFSEEYEPWNWPARYDLTLPAPVINLGSAGGRLLATTAAGGFVAGPGEPGQSWPMKYIEAPADIGCRPRSAISSPSGLFYASVEGLTLLKPDASFEVVTAPWFTGTEWRRLRPETARLAGRNNFIFCALSGETYSLDLTSKNLSTLSIRPDDLQVSSNGELIYLENNVLYQFDAGGSKLPYAWESREIEGWPASFSTAQVRADDIFMRLLGTGGQVYGRQVTDEKPFRLGRLGRDRGWKIGFYGTGTVERARLGYSLAELRGES